MIGNEQLTAARAEIEAILRKRDIGAHVILHCPGFTEVFMNLEPSYSRLRVVPDYTNPDQMAFRLHSNLQEHYQGDRDAQKRDLEATANMTSSIAQCLAENALTFMPLAQMMDKQLGAEHTPLHRAPEDKGPLQ